MVNDLSTYAKSWRRAQVCLVQMCTVQRKIRRGVYKLLLVFNGHSKRWRMFQRLRHMLIKLFGWIRDQQRVTVNCFCKGGIRALAWHFLVLNWGLSIVGFGLLVSNNSH